MPEGPECHLAAEMLNKYFQNTIITNIDFSGGRYLKHGIPKGLENTSDLIKNKMLIEKIYCKGKLIIWKFKNNSYLLNTLGMSGRWTFKKVKHCDVCFTFTLNDNTNSECKIWFKDQRHFGTFKLVNQSEFSKKIKSIGYDVLESTESDEFLTKEKWDDLCLQYGYMNLSNFLMDQTKISGIGNYLRSEIMYEAEINPFSYIIDLSETEINNLYKYIISITADSYYTQKFDNCNYNFKVYMRPVDINGYEVLRCKDSNNRMIHYVKEVQLK